MRPPRRIFRPSYAQPRLFRPGLAGAAVLAAIAVLATSGLSFPGPAHPAPAVGQVSSGVAGVAVIDGGTMRVDGQVVRLRGVDAPARGEACGGRDCGGAAAAALAALVRDRRVDCRLAGRDGQGKTVAACEAGGADLARLIIAGGWARAGTEVPELAGIEEQARRSHQGLWAAAGF